MKRAKTIFFGSDAIVLPALDFLAGADSPLELAGVFSQPDRPRGRGQQCQPNSVSAWALAHGVPLRRPEKIAEEDKQWLAESGASIALVMAYGHLLKDDLLSIPPLGFLNLHGSLLPAYRGASPVVGAIADGQTQTGVSLMRVVRAMDAGPVCDREMVPIGAQDDSQVIREKIAEACVPLLKRALPEVLAGRAVFVEQDKSRVSYTRKIDKSDGFLYFRRPAGELAARIRALCPWPACSIEVGGVRVKVYGAEALDGGHGAIPGTVLRAGKCGLQIAAGAGILNITQLQRPGGRRLCAAEFLRGFPMEEGKVLAGSQMRPLVSGEPFARLSNNLSFDKRENA